MLKGDMECEQYLMRVALEQDLLQKRQRRGDDNTTRYCRAYVATI
jgi:hypothetical protein